MFRERLKKALEEGVVLFAKYALVVALIYGCLMFFNGLMVGSQNGTQSALYLNQLIERGYLPKAVNGEVPAKPAETPVAQAK